MNALDERLHHGLDRKINLWSCILCMFFSCSVFLRVCVCVCFLCLIFCVWFSHVCLMRAYFVRVRLTSEYFTRDARVFGADVSVYFV